MNEIIQFFIGPYQEASLNDLMLELIAVFFGVISVYFAKNGKIWVFPTGIISTLIYIYITFIVGYFGDFIINIYYTLMSIYGWILWSNSTGENQLTIQWASRKEWQWTILIFIFTMIFITGIYLWFDKFEDWTNYLDVLTTGLAFGSMFMMARKKVDNWIGWILTDIISIPLYLAKGLGFTSLQFFIFLVLAIQGYRAWKKSTGMVSPN